MEMSKHTGAPEMKRLHVHVGVADLDESVRFYSTLFGAQPTKRESDYAKWMLDDPRVNFAISTRSSGAAGLSHLGIQAEDQDELDQIAARAKEAGTSVLIEKGASCCYARSNKAWVEDPTGIRWETFYTFGDVTTYGQSAEETRVESKASSTPLVEAASCCG
jgi:catechol 2,3-dioxygenase-like lactoylglutathione lyase family enzyme